MQYKNVHLTLSEDSRLFICKWEWEAVLYNSSFFHYHDWRKTHKKSRRVTAFDSRDEEARKKTSKLFHFINRQKSWKLCQTWCRRIIRNKHEHVSDQKDIKFIIASDFFTHISFILTRSRITSFQLNLLSLVISENIFLAHF